MKKIFARHFADVCKEFLAEKGNRAMLLLATLGPVAMGLILVGVACATDSPVMPLEPLVGIWLLAMGGMTAMVAAEAAARMRDQLD